MVDRELPEIVANADLLQWVFENLIRNSLDAIDKENGVIEIDPRLHPKEHQIVILYKDNGKGISRKNRNRIFRPGMTTKEHGWGLGLTLVKRIVEAYHHGQIRLIETSSQGTTFEVLLPVETVGDGRVSKLLTKNLLDNLFRVRFKDKKKGDKVFARNTTRKILWVDDEIDALKTPYSSSPREILRGHTGVQWDRCYFATQGILLRCRFA